MQSFVKQFIGDDGKNLQGLLGYTINFFKPVSIYSGSWNNKTGTLEPYVFIPGKIFKISKAQNGYYATWKNGDKVVGVTFGSLDDIIDVKNDDIINRLFVKLGIYKSIYKNIYEGTEPVKKVVDKAVEAGKALAKGGLKTAGIVLDFTKFLGNALPVIFIGGVILIAVSAGKKAKRAVT